MEEKAVKIVYWWDKFTKQWIMQALDKNGNELEENGCDYAPNKERLKVHLHYFAKDHDVNVIEKLKR